jgi:uncharacterized membrane-anchored protein YhcB (DUF1043 family)
MSKIMDKTQNFILKNFKSIAIVIGFLIGLYIQHLANVSKITSLENEMARLEGRVDAQYTRLDNVKLDKSVFEMTVQKLSDMSDDIREIRKSLDEHKELYIQRNNGQRR